jgi:hypothetical protein
VTPPPRTQEGAGPGRLASPIGYAAGETRRPLDVYFPPFHSRRGAAASLAELSGRSVSAEEAADAEASSAGRSGGMEGRASQALGRAPHVPRGDAGARLAAGMAAGRAEAGAGAARGAAGEASRPKMAADRAESAFPSHSLWPRFCHGGLPGGKAASWTGKCYIAEQRTHKGASCA